MSISCPGSSDRVHLWRREYNTVRPHSALGYRPPAPQAVDLDTDRKRVDHEPRPRLVRTGTTMGGGSIGCALGPRESQRVAPTFRARPSPASAAPPPAPNTRANTHRRPPGSSGGDPHAYAPPRSRTPRRDDGMWDGGAHRTHPPATSGRVSAVSAALSTLPDATTVPRACDSRASPRPVTAP